MTETEERILIKLAAREGLWASTHAKALGLNWSYVRAVLERFKAEGRAKSMVEPYTGRLIWFCSDEWKRLGSG